MLGTFIYLFIHPDLEKTFHIVILLEGRVLRQIIDFVSDFSKEYIIVILLEKIGWFTDKSYHVVN